MTEQIEIHYTEHPSPTHKILNVDVRKDIKIDQIAELNRNYPPSIVAFGFTDLVEKIITSHVITSEKVLMNEYSKNSLDLCCAVPTQSKC